MSKENAKKFLDTVSNDQDLKSKLLDSNAQAWVTSAKTAGLDITVDELADELIGTIRGIVTGELNEGSLDAVSGGAGPALANAQLTNQRIAPIGNIKPMVPGGLKVPGKGAARW